MKLNDTDGVRASVPTALERFKEIETEEPSLRSESPLERLRFFCSLAMHGQDWLDVEQFFDAVSPRGVPPSDGGQR